MSVEELRMSIGRRLENLSVRLSSEVRSRNLPSSLASLATAARSIRIDTEVALNGVVAALAGERGVDFLTVRAQLLADDVVSATASQVAAVVLRGEPSVERPDHPGEVPAPKIVKYRRFCLDRVPTAFALALPRPLALQGNACREPFKSRRTAELRCWAAV
ncbi:MAG: hypothetical protein ACLP50_29920 [Solirubrobacteraceae bacterium]